MVTNTEEETKVLCWTCGWRVADSQVENGKRRWKGECTHCRRERLSLPKQYGRAILSPRKRLTNLDRLSLSICSKCGWFGCCDVHHKDKNKNNGSSENLVVLCPNCHTDEHLGKPDIEHNQPTPNNLQRLVA